MTPPKIRSAKATVTYKGRVANIEGEQSAERAAKRHIRHMFEPEEGNVGHITMVIEETVFGNYSFMATFEVDGGPAMYVLDGHSEYI